MSSQYENSYVVVASIVVLLLIIALIGACAVKDYELQDFQNDYDSTLECLAEHRYIPSAAAVPEVNYVIVDGGEKINCSDTMARGCYSPASMTITLPADSNRTTAKHEFTEHALQSTGAIPSGHNHTHPGFADCAGIEVR